MIEEGGYLLQKSSHIQEAQVLAQSFPPDLVLLDLGLPDGDGSAFLESFRKWSEAPVLVLSAPLNHRNGG